MQEYAKVFEPYIRWANQFKFIRMDFEVFEIERSKNVLDIGCGFGDRVRLLRSVGYTNVAGIEPSEYSVMKADDQDIQLGDLYNTGHKDETLDAVIVENVFHHIDDYEKALTEIARILKPGGHLCFFEPRNSFLRRTIDFLTFKTFIPDLLKGPWAMRRIVMGQEFETGLYPLWLRSHQHFFNLLKEQFTMQWSRNNPFFFYAKCQRK